MRHCEIILDSLGAGGVPDESYFAPAELMAAQQVVALATQKAATLQPAKASASSSISNQ